MSFAKFSIEVNGNKDSAILSSVKKSYVYPFNENLKFQQATSYFSSWKLHLGLQYIQRCAVGNSFDLFFSQF